MFRSTLDALGVFADLKERGISLHMIDLGSDVTGNASSSSPSYPLWLKPSATGPKSGLPRGQARPENPGGYLGGLVPWGWRVGDDGELVAVAEQ